MHINVILCYVTAMLRPTFLAWGIPWRWPVWMMVGGYPCSWRFDVGKVSSEGWNRKDVELSWSDLSPRWKSATN